MWWFGVLILTYVGHASCIRLELKSWLLWLSQGQAENKIRSQDGALGMAWLIGPQPSCLRLHPTGIPSNHWQGSPVWSLRYCSVEGKKYCSGKSTCASQGSQAQLLTLPNYSWWQQENQCWLRDLPMIPGVSFTSSSTSWSPRNKQESQLWFSSRETVLMVTEKHTKEYTCTAQIPESKQSRSPCVMVLNTITVKQVSWFGGRGGADLWF